MLASNNISSDNIDNFWSSYTFHNINNFDDEHAQ